jgi:hypothetical protein
MLQHFEMIPFLVGVGLGIVALIYYKQPSRIVIKYPHPQHPDTFVYRDPNGICYKYKAKEVDCDENEATLQSFPLQEGYTSCRRPNGRSNGGSQ